MGGPEVLFRWENRYTGYMSAIPLGHLLCRYASFADFLIRILVIGCTSRLPCIAEMPSQVVNSCASGWPRKKPGDDRDEDSR